MSSSDVREVFFMKHIRKALAILLAMLPVISLAACGSSTENHYTDSNNTEVS